MKIKKKYSFTNKRQIWRLLPTDSNKIIIEDRDKESKEVFFSCLEINSGKIIFKNYQINDKFWVGIEAIYRDIVYFHRFLKPDMPVHSGIIAYDINTGKIIWKTDEYNFLFLKDDIVYTDKSKFEGREYYALDYKTGVQLEAFGNDSKSINILREEELSKNNFEGYLFSRPVDLTINYSFTEIIEELKVNHVITGKINYIKSEDFFFINFHEVLSNGKLRNIFNAVEIGSKKVILEEILDRETKLFIPESFFIKDNLVFLIKEKVKLLVYSF